MARPKIARKSTIVDMTAMCDVAFLLLSFFILTTKPKPSEAVPISTPTSVANKFVPDKGVVMISLNNEGHVYLSVSDNADDREKKKAMIEDLNTKNSLGLSQDEIASLVKQSFIGVSLAQLKQQAHFSTEQITAKNLPGIPALVEATLDAASRYEWTKEPEDIEQALFIDHNTRLIARDILPEIAAKAS
jgi:biopolymer transport protein ExbD